MANTIPKAFFAYPSRPPTLQEAIHVAVPELNKKGQVKIKNLFEKSKLISESCHFMGKCSQNRLILSLK